MILQALVAAAVALLVGASMPCPAVDQQLSQKLKQPFIIENQPGAGGNTGTGTGTELVVRAPADGHRLIVNSVGPIAVNPTLYTKLPYHQQPAGRPGAHRADRRPAQGAGAAPVRAGQDRGRVRGPAFPASFSTMAATRVFAPCRVPTHSARWRSHH